jgi:hypothetical protein
MHHDIPSPDRLQHSSNPSPNAIWLQFAQQVTDMILYRLIANPKLEANLLVRAFFSHQLQNLHLSRAEFAVIRHSSSVLRPSSFQVR